MNNQNENNKSAEETKCGHKENKPRWSPQAQKIINEMTDEYNKKIQEYYRNNDLNIKIHNLYASTDKKYREKCNDKINNLLQLVKEEGDRYVPLPGKEKDLDIASIELENCGRPFVSLANNFGYISHFTKKLFQMQVDYCYEDCNNIQDENKLRDCIQECSKDSVNYNFRALTELLSSTADSFQSELSKL
jgi:hypothetical protein